jgi:hypothetical protein
MGRDELSDVMLASASAAAHLPSALRIPEGRTAFIPNWRKAWAMNDAKQVQRQQTDAEATDQARQGLKRAETGKKVGARQIEEASAANPPAAEAAEQEVSDGPEGRGLAR